MNLIIETNNPKNSGVLSLGWVLLSKAREIQTLNVFK